MDRKLIRDYLSRDVFLRNNNLIRKNILDYSEFILKMTGVSKVENQLILENILLMLSIVGGNIKAHVKKSKNLKKEGYDIFFSVRFSNKRIKEGHDFFLVCIDFLNKKKYGLYDIKYDSNKFFFGGVSDKNVVIKNVYYTNRFGLLEYRVYLSRKSRLTENDLKYVISFLSL